MSPSRKIWSDSGTLLVLILMTIPLGGELARYCTYKQHDIPFEESIWPVQLMMCAVIIGIFYYGTNAFRRNQFRGPLVDSSDWPNPMRRMHSFLNETGVDTQSFSVYLLEGQPNRILSTVVCRLNIDDAG